MSSCSAASRREAPPSTRATTRMRMSTEYAFGMVRPPDESMPPDSPIYRSLGILRFYSARTCSSSHRAPKPHATLSSNGARKRSLGAMSDLECAFCKKGRIVTRKEELAFRQWTDRGYAHCRVEVPIGVCDRCGSDHWSQEADAIVEEAVRREYDKLPSQPTHL